jgi:hypothetical protein
MVKNHNDRLCRNYPAQFPKNMDDPTVRSSYERCFKSSESSIENPLANFSPVHAKKAVEAMSTFFQFLEQDFSNPPGADLFKAFFQKKEILKRLQDGDRFLILFGCADKEKPVCDFGFVRRSNVDEFRRMYVRTPKTAYNMTFDGKFPISDACRSFARRPGGTGEAQRVAEGRSEQTRASPGRSEATGPLS